MKINAFLVSVFVTVAVTGCGDSNSPILTASSQMGDYGPQGLFDAVQPGWHSVQPAKYPELLTVDFRAPREVKFIPDNPFGRRSGFSPTCRVKTRPTTL